MTRCGRTASLNLKSSVYNPNGQSYFDQLNTYNSMACHLRRVLTAKSVIDSRNERYTRVKQQKELKGEKMKRSLQQSPSCEIIDRLAYDTEHHPAEILKASANASKMHCNKRHKSPCYEEPIGSVKNSQKSKSNSRNPCKHDDCWYNKKYNKNSPRDKKKPRGINIKRTSSKCQMTKREQSPDYSSSFASDNDSSPHQSDNESSNDPKHLSFNKLMLHAEKEEARYAQFVYDITQDIVRKGLYTDKDFREIFRKHLDKNANILDKHRMLYEIYQLKISLNIDEEDDEEYEQMANYIYSKRFPTISRPKPPTPPKVLDENKVIEKLKNYEQLVDKRPNNNATSKKSVILVDANPELLITERDILQTLIDTNVDPDQAEHICRTLFHKSKDTSFCQMVQDEIKCIPKEEKSNNEKEKQNSALSKKYDANNLYQEKQCACSFQKEKVVEDSKFLNKRDVSATKNKKQKEFDYGKLLNIISQTSQVTRSILEQRTKLEKMKLKEDNYDANRRMEERQRKIHQLENADKKMERVLPADDSQKAEMKNVATTSTSAIFNVTEEDQPALYTRTDSDFTKSPLFAQKSSEEIMQYRADNLKMKKTMACLNEETKETPENLPSVINEEDENEDVDNENYSEDEEEVPSEKDESEIATYSKEFNDESKSEQNEINNRKEHINNENSVNVDDDTYTQYTEFDDQKDSISLSKDDLSKVNDSQEFKGESNETSIDNYKNKVLRTRRNKYKSKSNCSPNCKRRVIQNCNAHCNFNTEACFMRQNIQRCIDPRYQYVRYDDDSD